MQDTEIAANTAYPLRRFADAARRTRLPLGHLEHSYENSHRHYSGCLRHSGCLPRGDDDCRVEVRDFHGKGTARFTITTAFAT